MRIVLEKFYVQRGACAVTPIIAAMLLCLVSAVRAQDHRPKYSAKVPPSITT